MKTAETKTVSSPHLHQSGEPFFQKNGEGAFFSDRQTDVQAKPFFSTQAEQPFIQTKLTIGRPGDKYEQEADAMADRVVQRLSNPETIQTKPATSLANTVTPLVQPKCAACEEEEQIQKKEGDEDRLENGIQQKSIFESDEPPPEEDIQRKCAECLSAEASAKEGEAEEKLQKKGESHSSANGGSPSLESRLNASHGSGTPLPEDTRTQMESSFGADFSNVHIHTGSSAVQMNQELGAQAFTHGSDIYFNSGKYNPESTEGKHLLAHELTHTVQQGKVGPSPKLTKSSIQKKPTGEEIQDRLRSINDNLTTEAPIPGAAPRGGGIGFEKRGFADLFEANGSAIGLRGYFPPQNADDAFNALGHKKYIYYNMGALRSLRGPSDLENTRGPQSLAPVLASGNRASFYVDEQTNQSTHDSGASALSGSFPSQIKIGEIKGESEFDNPLIAPEQLRHYANGIRQFMPHVNRDFGPRYDTPRIRSLHSLTIPPGLDYSNFEEENDRESTGFLKERGRRVWLAEVGNTGIYLWKRFPDPFRVPPETVRREQEALEALRRQVLAIFERMRGNRPNGNLNRKEVPNQKETNTIKDTNQEPKKTENTSSISKHNTPNKLVQKNTDWRAARRNFQTSLRAWKRQHGRRFLNNNEVERYIEPKVEFDRALNRRPGTTGRLNQITRDYRKIDFWASPKGLIVGNLRILLGEKFDLLAEKIEGLKQRTRRVKTKARGLRSPGFSRGWMARIVRLLLRGFGVAFEQFLEYSFSVFAGCISGVIDKFEEEMRQKIVEGLVDEELEAQLNELREELQALIDSLEEQYEEHLAGYEEILEQMEDAGFYASIITTAVNLIRVGVQVVSCFTPPALGCLWGLVANIGIEVALNLVVGTEWFEEEFMEPLVGDLMEDFMRDSLLEFLNELFELVGLEDYVEGVEACTPSNSRFNSSRLYNPDNGIIIPPEMYQAHARAWEARNRSTLLNEVVNASGGTATQQDVERLIERVQEQNMTSEEFTGIVNDSKTSENSFDFGSISQQVPGLENLEGEGGPVRVIDGETSPMTGGVGSGRAGSVSVRNASIQHVKGSRVILTLLCVSTAEENIIITNVQTRVINRYYFDSSTRNRVSNRGDADRMQIVYQITNRSGYQVPFSNQTGVLPFEKTLRGYVEF